MMALISKRDERTGSYPEVGTTGRTVVLDGKYQSERALLQHGVPKAPGVYRVEIFAGDRFYTHPKKIVIVDRR